MKAHVFLVFLLGLYNDRFTRGFKYYICQFKKIIFHLKGKKRVYSAAKYE